MPGCRMAAAPGSTAMACLGGLAAVTAAMGTAVACTPGGILMGCPLEVTMMGGAVDTGGGNCLVTAGPPLPVLMTRGWLSGTELVVTAVAVEGTEIMGLVLTVEQTGIRVVVTDKLAAVMGL